MCHALRSIKYLCYGPCIQLALLSHAIHRKLNAAAQRCSVDTLHPHGLHGRCPRSEEHLKIADGDQSVEGTYCASSLKLKDLNVEESVISFASYVSVVLKPT